MFIVKRKKEGRRKGGREGGREGGRKEGRKERNSVSPQTFSGKGQIKTYGLGFPWWRSG